MIRVQLVWEADWLACDHLILQRSVSYLRLSVLHGGALPCPVMAKRTGVVLNARRLVLVAVAVAQKRALWHLRVKLQCYRAGQQARVDHQAILLCHKAPARLRVHPLHTPLCSVQAARALLHACLIRRPFSCLQHSQIDPKGLITLVQSTKDVADPIVTVSPALEPSRLLSPSAAALALRIITTGLQVKQIP